MRAVFLASKLSSTAGAAWAASLQASGTSVRHVVAWSGAGELGRRQTGGACNVDAFILGPGTSLETHVAQYCGGDGLLLVSLLEPARESLPRNGVVVLVWQPQLPQDIVQACRALPPCLADGASVRALLLVDASPSLTLSVTQKALEGAGWQALARKPTMLAPRTAQAPQAALQALLQFADSLQAPLAPPAPVGLSLAPGGVRIAVARDDAFGPCFHENLALLQQCGAQLLFFSPMYDAAIPTGATCLYLSSGPLEPERWQQLAANRPLLAAVRAFCDAGGMVLAEGAGLLYMSRTVDLNEGESVNKSYVHDMAGVLPFKARLLAEPQSASVELVVTSGNPLLPAGSRPRGYLSAQASIVLVEERQLHSLFLGVAHGPGATAASKGSSSHLSTTYQVTVVPRGQAVKGHTYGAEVSSAPVLQLGSGEDNVADCPPSLPEGYTLHNVLASSCLMFLPSEPGLAVQWLRRCASLDPAALATGMAQHLGGTASAAATQAGKMHFSAALGSAAGSRAGSRRQSIQDVSAFGAAYASNGSISSASSHSILTGIVGGCGIYVGQHHHNQQQQLPHHLQQQQQFQLLHNHHLQGTPNHAPPLVSQLPIDECAGAQQAQGGGACGAGSGCSGMCVNISRQPSNLSHSGSATGTSSLGLLQPPRRSLCGAQGLPLDSGTQGYTPCRSPNPNPRCPSPYTSPLPPAHPSAPRLMVQVGCGLDGPVDSPGLFRHAPEDRQQQQHQEQRRHGSSVTTSSQSTVSVALSPHGAVCYKLDPADPRETTSNAWPSDPSSPRLSGGATDASRAADRAEPLSPSNGIAVGGGMGDAPVSMHHTASAGSFAGYTPGGSSCSLLDLPQQRRPGGRQGDAGAALGASANAGWLVDSGAVVLHGPVVQWSPGVAPAAVRHGSVMAMGPIRAPNSVGHAGGVVCCSPGSCEALVAMGLANQLVGIGSDCDHPPDVCASRRAVLTWVPVEEAPQGPAARGIRVIMPGVQGDAGSVTGPVAGSHGCAGGGPSRGGRPSGDRCGTRGGRALVVDELALRQELPSLFVLPDPADLSDAELAQLNQALVETGLVDARGVPCSTCCVMTSNCRTLVDVMDLMLELGAALEESQAASMLLERLQTRLRRVVAAAAAVMGPARPLSTVFSGGGALPSADTPTKCARVLVLKSLQPLIEAGRWVPEMLALVGAAPCLALPGGADVTLTWQDVRERAMPDVLILLGLPGSGAADRTAACAGAGGQAKGSDGLQEQLAALASQPGWWCLPAVRVSEVYMVQPSYFARPGPRLVDGVELLARLLLPTQFTSSRKLPAGSVMRLSLAAGQRCRATLLPSYFTPLAFS